MDNINPFDILSGKVAKTRIGTFWFKEAGNNIQEGGTGPIVENLHRENGPAAITEKGSYWFLNGKPHRLDGPAAIDANGQKRWFINGKRTGEKEFKEAVNYYKRRYKPI